VLHALAEFSFLYIDKNNIISIISLLKIEINKNMLCNEVKVQGTRNLP
jgi:hypothetical protein